MKKAEVFLRNIVIYLLKLISRKSRKPVKSPDSKSKILVIRLNNIGDALVTTPLIKIIKKYTDAEIKVVAGKRNYFIFENNKNISDILLYDKSVKGFFRLLKQINSSDFDYIIDTHTDTSSTVSLLAAFTKASYKVCLQKNTSSLYNIVTPYDAESEIHIIEKVCRIAEALGISYTEDDIQMEYNFLSKSEDKAKYFIKNYCSGNGKIIGINFFAGSSARFWGTDKFIKLIDYLDSKDFRLVPISDTNNFELAKQICPVQKIFCGSFDELAALVSGLDYLITPDTSLVHLCSIYKIPAFIFFVKYRLSGSLWTPYKTYYESVITEESTLKNISFDEALIKIKKFLNIND